MMISLIEVVHIKGEPFSVLAFKGLKTVWQRKDLLDVLNVLRL